MWTLSQARARLGNRLAEASTVFWPNTERDDALNEAQRFIAAVTKGVPLTLSGSVDVITPFLTVSGKLLGEYAAAGRVDGGRALSFIPIEAADKIFPDWVNITGDPRWIIAAPHESRVYLSPVPALPTPVTVNVSVLPADLAGDTDELFAGVPVMEKFQGALLNIAASLLLLKERYDGDAERFYQFGVQEIQALGIDPASIPSMRGVTEGG